MFETALARAVVRGQGRYESHPPITLKKIEARTSVDRRTRVPVRPENPEPVPISSSSPWDVVSSQMLGDISFVRTGRIIPCSRAAVFHRAGNAVRHPDSCAGDEGSGVIVVANPIVGTSVGLLDRVQKVA